jgi:hypothetical protein
MVYVVFELVVQAPSYQCPLSPHPQLLNVTVIGGAARLHARNE